MSNLEDMIHHIENSQQKGAVVVPQLQFDYGSMGVGGPLQKACFLVGTDTSSGAIHAGMVPDSKKMDMPYVVATTARWVRDLRYECLSTWIQRRSSTIATVKSGKRISS